MKKACRFSARFSCDQKSIKFAKTFESVFEVVCSIRNSDVASNVAKNADAGKNDTDDAQHQTGSSQPGSLTVSGNRHLAAINSQHQADDGKNQEKNL